MTTGLSKDPAQIVVDLINRDNGTRLDASKLRFGLPQKTVGSTRNTQVLVTARAFSGMVGSVTVDYDRIDLDTVPGELSRFFYTDRPAIHISDLIPEINAVYNINLTKDDYIDGMLICPPTNEPELAFVIRATAKSLVYFGELHLYLADVSRQHDTDLARVLRYPNLDGFTYAFLSRGF